MNPSNLSLMWESNAEHIGTPALARQQWPRHDRGRRVKLNSPRCRLSYAAFRAMSDSSSNPEWMGLPQPAEFSIPEESHR